MDKEFIDVLQKLIAEQGKEVLVNGKAKMYLADYCGGQFKKEANTFRQILDAGCGEHINKTDDVSGLKRKLMVRLEDENDLSPKATAEYLDLLGLILKGDVSKCAPPSIQTNTPTLATGRVAAGIVPDNFVGINGGTFIMGSPANEPQRENDETQHQVTLSPFYMGKYPVTVGEFRWFVNSSRYRTDAEKGDGGYVVTWGNKPDANWNNPYFDQGDNQPVVLISWNDVVQYCNWLSGQKGLDIAYTINGEDVTWNRNANGYRLPTEAEWEYACRAGTTTPFSAGNNITTNQANYDGNNPYNNNAKGEYRGKTTPVGSFAANPWGLYDMHGNVWERCWDYLDDVDWGVCEDYPSRVQVDPEGVGSGVWRVMRGGSWYHHGQCLRSAHRSNIKPSIRNNLIGFRLVRG